MITQLANIPSPPFRGEREGPVAERWEGEVGDATHSRTAPLTLPSPPGRRGERIKLRVPIEVGG